MNPDDFRQSQWYADLLTSFGWNIQYLSNNQFICIWKIPFTPFSYLFAIGLNPPISFHEIEVFAKKYHAIYIHIEPLQSNQLTPPPDYQQTIWSTSPRKTIILKIYNSQKEQHNHFNSKVKHNLRKAEESDQTLEVIQNPKKHQIQEIYSLLSQTSEQRYFNKASSLWLSSLYKYAYKNIITINARTGKTLRATSIFIRSKDTLHYIYNGSDNKAKQIYSNDAIIGQAVKYAIRSNIKYLDFEGIEDDRNPYHFKQWQGFTQFKKKYSKNTKSFSMPVCSHRYKPLNRLFYLKEDILPLIYPHTI